jgi:hypothetical protein
MSSRREYYNIFEIKFQAVKNGPQMTKGGMETCVMASSSVGQRSQKHAEELSYVLKQFRSHSSISGPAAMAEKVS